MNDDQKFWLSIWKLVATTFCVFVLSVSGCVANNNRVLEGLVASGSTPMEAYCAIRSGSHDAAMCTAIALVPENMRKPK
jgi:hypothetical protein